MIRKMPLNCGELDEQIAGLVEWPMHVDSERPGDDFLESGVQCGVRAAQCLTNIS